MNLATSNGILGGVFPLWTVKWLPQESSAEASGQDQSHGLFHLRCLDFLNLQRWWWRWGSLAREGLAGSGMGYVSRLGSSVTTEHFCLGSQGGNS